MHIRHRATAARVVLAIACSLTAACPASAIQAKRAKGTTAPRTSYGSQVVATVDGESITRDQVFDEMLNNQMTRLAATNPIFADTRQLGAAQFPTLITAGQLVFRRMGLTGAGPASVTRAEVMRALFDKKAPLAIETVQNMIRERAVAHAAKAAGVQAAPADVNKKVAEFVQQTWRNPYRLQGQTDQQVMAGLGIVPAMVRRFVTFRLELEKLVRRDLGTKAGGALAAKDFVEASHIIILPRPTSSAPAQPSGLPSAPTPADIDKAYQQAKAQIDQAVADVNSGKKTFAQAAGEVNTDETKFANGKMGVVVRGQLDPSVDKVLFSLPKGKMSEPIRTPTGWQVLYVDKTGAELTAPERDQALQRVVDAQLQKKVTEIVSKAKVTNTLPPPAAPAISMPRR